MRLSASVLREIFQNRNFRRQYIARAVSFMGGSMSPIALSFAILGAGMSASDLGLALAAESVPMALLLLFGGVWGDRYRRNRVMATADLVRLVSQGTLATAFIIDRPSLALILGAQIVNGLSAGLFRPAASGLTRASAAPGRLQESNSLLSVTSNTLTFVGPMISAVLVSTIGPGWSLAVDAASFGVSAYFCHGLRLPPVKRVPGSKFFHEFVDGWREVVTRSWVWITIIGLLFAQAAYGAFDVLGPVIANGSLGGVGAWAAVLAAFSAGSVIGGVVGFSWHPNRLLLASKLAGALIMPLFVLLAVEAPLVAILAAAILAGAGDNISDLLWKVSLQEHIPEEVLSRVSSFSMGSLALAPLTLVLAPALAQTFGTVAVLAGSGILAGGSILLALVLPSVRSLKRDLTPNQSMSASAEAR